jgi:hypothetical protein
MNHSTHLTVMAADINGFGSRPDWAQLAVRQHFRSLVDQALERAGIAPEALLIEDRGDGFLALAPSTIPAGEFVDQLVPELRAGLRRHNAGAAEVLRLRVRLALHEGHVHRDAWGFAGDAVNHTFRLLEADGFKAAFAADWAHLGLIVSRRFYEEVIAPGLGRIDPDSFHELMVINKETRTRAWVEGVCLPVNATQQEVVGRRV